ncbi:MAG: YdeI/OmpD-associated family protein [Microthrixaceae bacterium]
MQNPEVDKIINQSTKWTAEMLALRPVLLACGLTEVVKWHQACYCHDGKNIVIMTEMKDAMTLGFFKGELLTDPKCLLQDNGPNSRSARRMYLRSSEEVIKFAEDVKRFVAEAISVEEAGLSVGPAPAPDLAEELQVALDRSPDLAAAFDALTPGRQREYNLFISGAKQSATRASRVQKYIPQIMKGIGMRDR